MIWAFGCITGGQNELKVRSGMSPGDFMITPNAAGEIVLEDLPISKGGVRLRVVKEPFQMLHDGRVADSFVRIVPKDL